MVEARGLLGHHLQAPSIQLGVPTAPRATATVAPRLLPLATLVPHSVGGTLSKAA